MARALISLGSNLGDRRQTLADAVALLQQRDDLRVQRVSTWHETRPIGGPPDQAGHNWLAKLGAVQEEMVGAVSFVDDLYRSPEGLMRPDGLYSSEAKRVDAEAIGTWVLDVYLQARIAGKSDADARQSITDAIKGSDEWRKKHSGR